MIITTLSITNFGVYSDANEFDLRPQRQGEHVPPIILIGGKNGSGKTTFLEAIRLCLYGRLALGSRVRKTDYETYIKQRFHRSKHYARSARIGLIFEHVYAGRKSIYDAVRSWQLDGDTLKESISIYKDGQILRDIAPDYWNDFLRDLIPPGVADLFFFDGEHIQNLADVETEEAALETAIGGLLNLDIVERLQSDLQTYIKQRDGKQQSSLAKDHAKVSQEYEVLTKTLNEKKQDKAGFQSQLDHISKRLEDARQSLLVEGAQFIEQRTHLEQKLIQVTTQIQDTRQQVQNLATGLLPFAFTPKWSQKLQTRLLTEADIRKQKLLLEYKQQKLKAVKNLFVSKIADNLSPHQEKTFLQELEALFVEDVGLDSSQLIHHISEQQREQLLNQIQQSSKKLPITLNTLSQKLESLTNERIDIQQKLKQVPDDEIGLPLIQKFQRLSEKRGRLQEKLMQFDKEIGQIKYQQEELNRQRSRLWHKIAEVGDKDQRVEQAAKIQVVLEAYLERITILKIQQLEQLVAQYFNLLCRKEMLVKKIKIDPKQYQVTLYGDNRTELHKSKLSAGERQLYAMSLLWALRAVSGRSLPIIIDTPLGRLDSEHRQKLLTHFFPHAAHQIILLSTDTEVNATAFETLQPEISHVYRLEFDTTTRTTQIKRGYFELPTMGVMA